ncbi:glycosyltransferase [Streptomyces sp. NPDC057702]|uniref:glycosyltransferase family 4 protein n=1 Tax=unclassified Streptomyces TaxID=2593676 RepID=UPI0036C259D2
MPQDNRSPRDPCSPCEDHMPNRGAAPGRRELPGVGHGSGPCAGAPLTVLHVAQPVTGGVAQVVADLVRGQRADGLRPVVACPPEGPLAGAVVAAGAEVLPWPARREPGPGLAAETARLARLVRRLGPDLVHTHSAKAGLAGRLALRGRVPTLHQPHAWSFDAAEGALRAAAVRWERYAARWAARLVCVSEAERRRGVAEGIAARWAVVPNGVDTDRFPPADAAARRAARAALPALRDVPANAPLVVCVGRLCRQKGQDVLLAAWPHIAARVPDAHLVLVGDGPARAALEGAAPPGVRFAGATRESARWYAAADLVVLPSRWEGMALAPLEAMACGRPVVLTDVTGARESLAPGHAPSCLAPPADPGALALLVSALLADPARRARLGAQARRHTRERHDVRSTVARMARLYEAVLSHRPQPRPQPQPQPRSQSWLQPQPWPRPRSRPSPDARPGARLATRPRTRPDLCPDTGPGARSDTGPDASPGTRPDPGPTIRAKAQTGRGATGVGEVQTGTGSAGVEEVQTGERSAGVEEVQTGARVQTGTGAVGVGPAAGAARPGGEATPRGATVGQRPGSGADGVGEVQTGTESAGAGEVQTGAEVQTGTGAARVRPDAGAPGPEVDSVPRAATEGRAAASPAGAPASPASVPPSPAGRPAAEGGAVGAVGVEVGGSGVGRSPVDRSDVGGS